MYTQIMQPPQKSAMVRLRQLKILTKIFMVIRQACIPQGRMRLNSFLRQGKGLLKTSMQDQHEKFILPQAAVKQITKQSFLLLKTAKRKAKCILYLLHLNAVLHTLKKLEKQGFEITLLDVHKNGIIDPVELKNAIKDTTCLVTIMFANNEIGTIQPIAAIGKICREKGVLFHTDAVQACGHIPIDVQKMNIDMLSLSAHKFHGPKGVGALYCRNGIQLHSLIEGGAQERSKRAGTENLPAIIGMAQAFDEACGNMEKNEQYISSLRDRLIEGLSDVPHSVVNGDIENRLPGNVNMCFEGIEGESLLLLLDMKGIAASSGSACTSGSLDPSHVLLAIGLPHEVAHGSLRLTLSEENTVEEIDYIIKEVPQVVEYLRNISPVWEALEKGEINHVI